MCRTHERMRRTREYLSRTREHPVPDSEHVGVGCSKDVTLVGLGEIGEDIMVHVVMLRCDLPD